MQKVFTLAICLTLSVAPAFASVKTKLKKAGLVCFSAATFIPRWGCYLAVVPLAVVLEKTDKFIDRTMTKIEKEELKEKLSGIEEDAAS